MPRPDGTPAADGGRGEQALSATGRTATPAAGSSAGRQVPRWAVDDEPQHGAVTAAEGTGAGPGHPEDARSRSATAGSGEASAPGAADHAGASARAGEQSHGTGPAGTPAPRSGTDAGPVGHTASPPLGPHDTAPAGGPHGTGGLPKRRRG
ncbi:hypothetical protein HOY81_26880, partial [Streptomyces sp. JJ36]|nr:hypothetical protein [Streptomyces sp. JJ36]